MFGKNKPEENAIASLRAMNQFGQGTTINGDVTTEGDVRIDGRVNGNVTSKAKTVVGAAGVIEGDIQCQNAHIEGRVTGNVEASELLFLSKTAHITGDITIKKLVVEEGAKFTGRCVMGMSIARNENNEKPLARPKYPQTMQDIN
ncbi:MAG TPA: polymer-forming cytoskeletal protein [Chitinophagales bacterium]|nr:polymer-forming cytoskeletal protein [Chitinophagales bacterium]